MVHISVSQVIEFLPWGSKLVRFLAQIEHTPRKFLYLVTDQMPGLQKAPKVYFQSQFSMSKATEYFQFFY